MSFPPSSVASYPTSGALPPYTPPTSPAPSTAQPTGLVLSGDPEPDKFLVLAGAAFAGKTTASLSFPNPLVLNVDNKVPSQGIATIPFYDDAFCDSIIKRANQANPANRRDAVANWIAMNRSTLSQHTVILDSLSSLENAFYSQTFEVEKKWGVNGGLFFGSKLSYFSGICDALRACARRVIVNCHLLPVFAKDPNLGVDISTGKFKPACAGSFAEKLPTFATTVAYAYRDNDISSGTSKFLWALRPTMAFEACTLAKRIPASGIIDVTKNAYEAFKACF